MRRCGDDQDGAQYSTVQYSVAGVCLCGSGFGTFTLAPLAQLVLEAGGWRWVMRALGLLSLLGLPCGAAITPPGGSGGRGKQQQEEDY